MFVRRAIVAVAVASAALVPLAACSSDVTGAAASAGTSASSSGAGSASGSSASSSGSASAAGPSVGASAAGSSGSASSPSDAGSGSSASGSAASGQVASSAPSAPGDSSGSSSADEDGSASANKAAKQKAAKEKAAKQKAAKQKAAKQKAAKKAHATKPAAGMTPEWGYAATTNGKKLGVVKNASVSVTVYEVAITKSRKNSMLVDAKTKKPLIKIGDKIVWVNYVVTNTSSKPINLSYNLVDIEATYPDWPYLSGMAGVTDSEQAEKLDVHTFAIKPNTTDAPFVLGAGQSYEVGENFAYQGKKKLDLSVTVTPANKKGDLEHDKSTEFKGSVTIV